MWFINDYCYLLLSSLLHSIVVFNQKSIKYHYCMYMTTYIYASIQILVSVSSLLHAHFTVKMTWLNINAGRVSFSGRCMPATPFLERQGCGIYLRVRLTTMKRYISNRNIVVVLF